MKAISDGSIIDIDVDPRDTALEALRVENRQLQRQLSDANIRADRAREDADRALSMLRRQLSPLYRSLQAVFGELDAAGVSDGPAPDGRIPSSADVAGPDARVQAVWNAWKAKLPPSCGRVIDALLIHGELNAQQICVAASMSPGTLHGGAGVLAKLTKAGLLNKNGGRVSLKSL